MTAESALTVSGKATTMTGNEPAVVAGGAIWEISASINVMDISRGTAIKGNTGIKYALSATRIVSGALREGCGNGSALRSLASTPAATAMDFLSTLVVVLLIFLLFCIVSEASDTQALTDEQKEMMEQLEAIGYLAEASSSPQITGVTVHDESRAFQGLNFYVTADEPKAFLMDMDGTVLHKWSYPFRKAFPDYEAPLGKRYRGEWRRAFLLENGDVLAIFEGLGLIKIDKESNLLWTYSSKPHHDLFLCKETDNIYVLTRQAKIYPPIHEQHPVLDDFVCILDSSGKEINRVSILDSLRNSAYVSLFRRMRKPGDVLHTNTVEVLDGSLADKIPAFKKGNVLLSCCEISTVCVLDMEQESIVWALSTLWDGQHQPTILDNGNMLVFDNTGAFPYSRVIEVNPLTQQIDWIFEGDESNSFFSDSCGSSQRLPNGNTLITDSNSARAIEVTPDKAIVWEFVNPHKVGPPYKTAQLYEVVRIPPEFPLDWIKQVGDQRLRELDRPKPPSPFAVSQETSFRVVHKWDFEGDNPAQGWRTAPVKDAFTIQDGICRLNFSEIRPALVNFNTQLDANSVNRVRIRMRSDRGTHGLVHWGRRTGESSHGPPFSSSERVTYFLIVPDGVFHEYTIALDRSADWAGQWSALCILPATLDRSVGDMLGAKVEVDWIALGFAESSATPWRPEAT